MITNIWSRRFRYKGPLCNNLESAVELGPSSQVYTTFVSDLVCKLSSFYRIGIEVSPITGRFL